MTDRYHRAARDGYLEVLREATKKDCNSRDEDGMTPTLWAAFEGNQEALTLLVGRGGDPDKCDHYGNTALHLAAAKGHLECVKFLVNFGVNLYSLDIDQHTAQELAAMNDCTDILRYLDVVLSTAELENPKQVKKLKEKAEKEAARLLKDFGKHLEKAEKLAKEEKKELEKEIRTMTISEERENFNFEKRRHSTAAVPRFSDMVGPGSGSSFGAGSTDTGNFKFGTVFKKVSQRRKSQISVEDHFKIRDKEPDGKLTVRKLNGLRRDSEIIFVPKKASEDESSEGLDNFDGRGVGLGRLGGGDTHLGIFDRPGLGSLAFRKSMTASLFSFGNNGGVGGFDGPQDESIGSAGSLAHRSHDEDEEDEDDDDFGPQFMPVGIFLAGLGMQEWIPAFRHEKIDLNSLMLLDAEDLREMGLPKGPVKTILKAIEDRKKDMADDSPIEDTQL